MTRKKIAAKERELTAMMSHVVRKLVYMHRYPPSIGPIIHPRAYEVLYKPAALSLIEPEWIIPSYSRTPSMISGSRGTKLIAQAHPSMAKPIDDM